jgi:hypothetical protein
VKVLAKACVDVRNAPEPLTFRRFQLLFAIDDAHIDIGPVTVAQQFLDPAVEPKVRTYQDDALFRALDDLFDEIVDAVCGEELCHGDIDQSRSGAG